MFPKSGDVIGNKYRVEGVLGRGGMATVFAARHEVTRKRFAVKVILPDVDHFDEIAKRFIREAQVTGHFQHPNVVDVYDIGRDGSLLFMVMELLHGETLAHRLKREIRLGVLDACNILLPCLDGIAAAHSVGIIHRDLKPANIFLRSPRGRGPVHPMVLDFGISKLNSIGAEAETMRTESGVLMGTPYYMAPEQLRAMRLDERVDVYALGVTLYELLTGRHPFEANHYPQLVLKIASETPIPIEQLVKDVPAGLAAIVRRAMARDREDRFPTVDKMAAAIADYAGASERERFESQAHRTLPTHPQSLVRHEPLMESTERTTTPLTSESLLKPNVRVRRLPSLWLGLIASFVLAFALVSWLESNGAPATHATEKQKARELPAGATVTTQSAATQPATPEGSGAPPRAAADSTPLSPSAPARSVAVPSPSASGPHPSAASGRPARTPRSRAQVQPAPARTAEVPEQVAHGQVAEPPTTPVERPHPLLGESEF